jgi:hypothetical protein
MKKLLPIGIAALSVLKRHRGQSGTPEPLADSSARFPHLPRKHHPPARKTPVRQALSQRVAVCGRLGGTSTMVRIADLGEQCGRSSEALPIPGYFSKEQWFRL